MSKLLQRTALVALAGLLLTRSLLGEDLNVEAFKKTLLEEITPLTAEQLASKIPLSYYFDYNAQPQPGKRIWKRVNNSTWHEVYPDGLTSTFKVLGHTTLNEDGGTILVKVTGDPEKTETNNTGGLQVFIPDKGSKTMHHFYRNSERGDLGWFDLGEMKEVR